MVNGINIRDIDYDEYISLFATVFQDFKLFALSLKDNVALNKSDEVSDDDVARVLRKVGFGDKLDTLPHGVHTHVFRRFDGEGFEPSGGEAQKIVLARALYKDAPVIVLDEPTAALDPRAEYEISAIKLQCLTRGASLSMERMTNCKGNAAYTPSSLRCSQNIILPQPKKPSSFRFAFKSLPRMR